VSLNRLPVIRPQIGDKLSNRDRFRAKDGKVFIELPPGCHINSKGYVRQDSPQPAQEAA